MSGSVRSGGLALVLLFLVSALVFAQTPNGKAGKPAQPIPKPEPLPVVPKSDPTVPSDKLRQDLEAGKTGPEGAPRMPYVFLRGRVLAEGKPPVALLELDPKQPAQPVTKGTTLMIANVKLSVTEVTATEVRIEVSPLNETIVLR